jgi:hypothetical protein
VIVFQVSLSPGFTYNIDADAMSPCRRRHLNGRAAVVSRIFLFKSAAAAAAAAALFLWIFFVTQPSILFANETFFVVTWKGARATTFKRVGKY